MVAGTNPTDVDSAIDSPDFRVLFEGAPGLYLALTPELRIAAASDAYLQATMTRREDILGRGLFEIFPDNPADPGASGRRNLDASLQRVLRSKLADAMAVQKFDVRRPSAEGGAFEERYWSPLNAPVLGSDGAVVAIIHRVEDVTELMRLWRVGVEQDKRVRALTSATERMEAEIYLRAQEVQAANHRLEATNQALQTTANELAEAKARIDLYARSLEGQKRLSDEKYRLLMETARDGILILDEGGRVVEANRESEAMLGLPRGEFVGRPLRQFLAADNPPDVEAGLRALPASGVWRREGVLVQRTGGEPGQFDVAASRVRVAEGDVTLCILHDVTDRNRLEGQLRRVQKLEAIGQLTGGLAHDFNNLLTIIAGNLDLLLGRLVGDEFSASFARDAIRGAERGAELTRRLLAFARKQTLQPEALPLNQVVNRMVAMLRRTLGEDISIETVLSGELWRALADPSQVEDAILNLAVNARDAMPNGGQLLIETANVNLDEHYAARNVEVIPGDYVVLTVTDTGGGIAPEVLDRVFEPFFTTKQPGRGTGLGLSMVYGFAKQSRGHLKIYSEVGHGTCVKLYLPRETSPSAAEQPGPTMPALRGSVGQETILVVEDDPEVRTVAVMMLETLGYRILQADSGRAALDILRRPETVDLLFTDLVMPNGMNGHDLWRAARRERPYLKALFTSGYSETFINLTRADGVDRSVPVVGKPYRRHELAERVRSALEAG